PEALPSGVSAYEISGPLFFGAAQRAMAALEIVSQKSDVVVLLMDDVDVMDATGLVALESALSELRRHNCSAILCGVRAEPLALLERSRILERERVFIRQTSSEAFVLACQLVSPPAPIDTSDAQPATGAAHVDVSRPPSAV